MSTCSRCGAQFSCVMADGAAGPCWCTQLPPLVPVPEQAPQAGGATAAAPACWCPACLAQHIARQATAAPGSQA